MVGLEMKYFVLKPASKNNDDYAFASRMAMRVYASNIKNSNPKLATDLHSWVDRIENALKENP